MAYTEKNAIDDYKMLFQAVEYGLKAHKLTSIEEVSAFLVTGLTGFLGLAVTNGDRKKADKFVDAVDKIVKDQTKGGNRERK